MDDSGDCAGWRAFIAWTTETIPDGGWELRLADRHGETSKLVAAWPSAATPPTLLDRYDALASLGFAVVEGGAEAWKWREHSTPDGDSLWVAHTKIRRLRADELPAGQPLGIEL